LEIGLLQGGVRK